jgi:hypothetical protein
MLEYCVHFEDYENASGTLDPIAKAFLTLRLAVLESASIFFCQKDSKGGRVYVESAIKSHRLWQSVRFWEESMNLALHNASHESEMEEFMLNWLMNASHKMLYFGMDPTTVRHTVFRLADRHNLQPTNVQTLQQFVHNIIQAVAIESN